MESEPDFPARDLYPGLSELELRETENNLEQYVALALRIYERVAGDPVLYPQVRVLLGSGGTLGLGTPEG